MKKKSMINAHVHFDVWSTPVVHSAHLDLEAVFQTTGDIYFFFNQEINRN